MSESTATLGLSIDSRPVQQAREQLRGFREEGRAAAEAVRMLSSSAGEAVPRFQDFITSAERSAGSFQATASSLDLLISRTNQLSALLRQAPQLSPEYLRIGAQMEVLARGFNASTAAVETFVRTSRELGVSANETVSALARIQAAIQGVTAEGQAAREVLRNYGVNVEGRSPQDAAQILREFRSNFRNYAPTAISQAQFNAVIPGASLETQASFGQPSTMTEAQRQRQMEADASARRAAEARQANLMGVRQQVERDQQFDTLNAEYGRGLLSIFDGEMPDWYFPFASRRTQRRELEDRRRRGDPTNEDYRRMSPVTRWWNAPGISYLDIFRTDEDRRRAQEIWAPRQQLDENGRDRRRDMPVRSADEWWASEEYEAQQQERAIIYQREREDVAPLDLFGRLRLWGRDLRRAAQIRDNTYLPTLSADDPRLQNPNVAAFNAATESMRERMQMRPEELVRQGEMIEALSGMGVVNDRFARMRPEEILDSLGTGLVGQQRRAAILMREGMRDQALNLVGDRQLADMQRITRAGEEGVDLSRFGLPNVEGGGSGGYMAGMQAQEVMRALIGIEREYKTEQEQRLAVVRALATLEDQLTERRRIATRLIEDQTRALRAQSGAITEVMEGRGPNTMLVQPGDAGGSTQGLSALAAGQLAGLREQAARPGAPTLSTLVRADAAQVLFQGAQQIASQRVANDNAWARAGVQSSFADGRISAEEAQRQLTALRDAEQVQGLMVRAAVARAAGEREVAEQLERQAEAMKAMAGDGRDTARVEALASMRAEVTAMQAVTAAMVAASRGAPAAPPPAAQPVPAPAEAPAATPAIPPVAAPAATRPAVPAVPPSPGGPVQMDPSAPDYDPVAASRARLAQAGWSEGSFRANPGLFGQYRGLEAPSGRLADLTPSPAQASLIAANRDRDIQTLMTASPLAGQGPAGETPSQRDLRLRSAYENDREFRAAIDAQYQANIARREAQARPGQDAALDEAGRRSDGSPESRRALAVRRAQDAAAATGATADAVDRAGRLVSAEQRRDMDESALAAIYATSTSAQRMMTGALGARQRQALPSDAWRQQVDEQVAAEVDAGALPVGMVAARRSGLEDQQAARAVRDTEARSAALRQEVLDLRAQAEATRAGGAELARVLQLQQDQRPVLEALSMARQADVAAREAAAAGDVQEADRLRERARLLREAAENFRTLTGARNADRGSVTAGREGIRQGDAEADLRLQANAPFWQSEERVQRDLELQRYRRSLERDPDLSPSQIESLVARQDGVARLRELAREAQQLRGYFDQAGQAATSALSEIVVRGGSAQDVLARLSAQLASLAVQAGTNSIFKQIGGFFSGALGSIFGGGGGGDVGSILGGGVADSAGNILPFAQGGVVGPANDNWRGPVDAVAMRGATRFFSQGTVVTSPTSRILGDGTRAIAGEGGRPEAILPLERLADGSLGVAATGGGGGAKVTIIQHFNASGGTTQQNAELARMAGEAADKAMRAAMQEEQMRSMRLGGMLQPVFGR